MELKNVSTCIAGVGRVLIVVLIVLIAVTIAQGFVMEAIRMCASTNRTTATKSEPPKTEERKIERIRQSARQFLPDGTIHLVYELRTEAGRPVEPRTQQIYDVNDRLLWEGPADKKSYEYLSWAEQPSRYYEAFARSQIRGMQTLTPTFSRTIEVPVGSLNNTEQIWRYRPGTGCFEGYSVGGERIGYIGVQGFVDLESKAKPFGELRFWAAWCPRDSSIPALLWQTNRRVYQINVEKRQVELLFESADSEIESIYLHGWEDLNPGAKGYVDTQRYRPLLMCITQDGVHHVILREPNQRLSFGGPRCSVTATREGIYALRYGNDMTPAPSSLASPELYREWREQYNSRPRNMWVELYIVSDDGKLELFNRYDWTVPAPGRFMQTESELPARRFVTSFSPPLYSLVVRALGREFWLKVDRSARQGDFFCGMLLQFLVWFGPLNGTVNWVLSVLMMSFVFWHGLPRRISNTRFAFWVAFVGLLNVTGLLTYLALNYTAIVKCPACGRRRGLAQSDCIRCQAPLPAPKPRELDLILTNQ